VKILVVDDDQELRTLIAFALRQASYLVVEAADGEEALERFAAEAPDLVVLDVNLPRASGLEVLRRLRAGWSTPVLLLTVRAGEEDQVQGLDLGADDYMAKPFSPRTLLARVRALLRRASGTAKPAPLRAGVFVLDPERQTVTVGDAAPVRLTPLEARLLQILLANGDETMPAERLLRHVWGARGSEDRQLLKQLVHRLRQKIERDAARPRFLLTVGGVGYQLAPAGDGGG
jgi:DNA-binding response OmpR family regulator